MDWMDGLDGWMDGWMEGREGREGDGLRGCGVFFWVALSLSLSYVLHYCFLLLFATLRKQVGTRSMCE